MSIPTLLSLLSLLLLLLFFFVELRNANTIFSLPPLLVPGVVDDNDEEGRPMLIAKKMVIAKTAETMAITFARPIAVDFVVDSISMEPRRFLLDCLLFLVEFRW
jgi:hypothetical protein